MTPNSKLIGALVSALLVGLPPVARAQSPHTVYQQALRLEQVQGNLEAAIGLFRQVVAAGDRALAARALVHIGRSYERLGKSGAEVPYRRVLAEYRDQREPVEQARARLTALGRPAGATAAAAAAGVVIRLMAAAEDLDADGQVSPDGRLIATVGGASGGGSNINMTEADLVVQDLATGARRRLTSKEVLSEAAGKAIWSPDGSRIAYAWGIDPGSTELRSIAVDGSDMKTLFRGVPDLRPEAWTADGRQVLTVLTRPDETAQLALVPVDGGAPQVLETFRDSLPTAAGFSPDQRWVGYSIPSARGDHDLVGVSIDGDRKVMLLDHPADDRFLGWALGGILFTSNRRGTIDLFLLPTRDGQAAGPPILVKVNVGRIRPSGFDRRGALYYRSEVPMIDVYTRPVDPSTWRSAGEATVETGMVEGKSWLPDWSPDGGFFGYVTQLGEAEIPTVVVRREGSGEERRVELPPGLDPFSLRLAPSGNRVLIAGHGGQQVLLANLAAGTYEALPLSRDATMVAAAMMTPSFAWSADGQRIFYTSLEGAGRLMVRELATGHERELYRAPGRGSVVNPTLSSDGRLLAFVVGDSVSLGSSAVLVMSADGGPPRELVRHDRGWLRSVAFTPDGRHVIYVARRVPPDDHPPLVLYRVPVAGGEPELLELPAERSMRFRPDGRRVAFSLDRTFTEIWALEDFTRPRNRER